MLEGPEETITETKVLLGFLLHIYNFGNLSNLVTFNGLKHPLECISCSRYAQMRITSNRLAVPLFCLKPKIINGVARRV